MDGKLETHGRSLRAWLAAAITVIACLGLAQTASASNPNTALLNGESVTTAGGITNGSGEPISLEQFAAENAGFHVTVVSGAQWEAMSAAEFAQYQVLIVGDPKCRNTAASANASATVWAPVVMGTAGFGTVAGNRAVIGTDPEYHYTLGEGGAAPTNPADPTTAGAEHLVQDGIAFAGAVAGSTGIYYDTSCGDSSGADVATLNLLTAGGGEWVEATEGPECEAEVRQIATNPAFSTGPTKLTDHDINGWECSSHVSFVAYPGDWTALAITLPLPEEIRPTPVCGNDIETGEPRCGQAYVLVAGQGVVAKAPNLSLEPEVGSDPAGGTHTVTANVHKEGKPIVGTPVSFVVTELNAGVTGTCTTGSGAPDPECKSDENGNVRFTYSDAHGVGKDTIIASVTLENTIEEQVPDAVVRKFFTTERATATEEWTPVAAPAPAPAPVTAVLAAKAASPPKGKASIASVRGCIASTSYIAAVHGSSIASVTVKLDGHTVKTLRKPTSKNTYAVRLPVKAGAAHHVTIRVVFTSASKTASATFHRTLARCAARRVLPRFTG